MTVDGMDVRRLDELALRAARTGRVCFTKFLDPAMAVAVRAAAGRAGVEAALWGGYPDAERCLAAFYDGEPPAEEDYPLLALRIAWNGKFADPGHRDLLGAVMGLGIDRETTGDVAIGEHRGERCAWLFALPEVADYIAANLDSAGRAAVKVSVADGPPNVLPPQGENLRVTVQHARLDAVLAAAYRLSRSEAQRLIASGLVKLNHVSETRPDVRLEAGDLISARGCGRVRVQSLEGETRRGRLAVMLFKYGK